MIFEMPPYFSAQSILRHISFSEITVAASYANMRPFTISRIILQRIVFHAAFSTHYLSPATCVYSCMDYGHELAGVEETRADGRIEFETGEMESLIRHWLAV